MRCRLGVSYRHQAVIGRFWPKRVYRKLNVYNIDECVLLASAI